MHLHVCSILIETHFQYLFVATALMTKVVVIFNLLILDSHVDLAVLVTTSSLKFQIHKLSPVKCSIFQTSCFDLLIFLLMSLYPFLFVDIINDLCTNMNCKIAID